MNLLQVFWADTRGKVIVTLLMLWVGFLIHTPKLVFFLYPVVAVVAMSIFDMLVCLIRNGKPVVTVSAVITGLLIGLIFDPTAGYPLLILSCFVASLSKQFLAVGNHAHIFNPAAFALVTVSLLFGKSVSWWGAAWGVIPAIIIGMGMIVALGQIRRIWMAVMFLIMYFVNLGLIGTWIGALHLTIDGTVFLFAWVMLPEPVTSVGGHLWRYGWPISVMVGILIQQWLHVFVADPMLLSLLFMNLLAFAFVRKPWAQ